MGGKNPVGCIPFKNVDGEMQKRLETVDVDQSTGQSVLVTKEELKSYLFENVSNEQKLKTLTYLYDVSAKSSCGIFSKDAQSYLNDIGIGANRSEGQSNEMFALMTDKNVKPLKVDVDQLRKKYNIPEWIKIDLVETQNGGTLVVISDVAGQDIWEDMWVGSAKTIVMYSNKEQVDIEKEDLSFSVIYETNAAHTGGNLVRTLKEAEQAALNKDAVKKGNEVSIQVKDSSVSAYGPTRDGRYVMQSSARAGSTLLVDPGDPKKSTEDDVHFTLGLNWERSREKARLIDDKGIDNLKVEIISEPDKKVYTYAIVWEDKTAFAYHADLINERPIEQKDIEALNK